MFSKILKLFFYTEFNSKFPNSRVEIILKTKMRISHQKIIKNTSVFPTVQKLYLLCKCARNQLKTSKLNRKISIRFQIPWEWVEIVGTLRQTVCDLLVSKYAGNQLKTKFLSKNALTKWYNSQKIMESDAEHWWSGTGSAGDESPHTCTLRALWSGLCYKRMIFRYFERQF